MPRNLGSLAGSEPADQQEETGCSGPRGKGNPEGGVPRRGSEKEKRYSFCLLEIFPGAKYMLECLHLKP